MALIAAFENADNVGAENLEEAADQAAVVAEDRADLPEAAADIASDAGDVSAATDDMEELEEIGDVAQAAVDSGEGLSEQAAEVATIAIERIVNRLGFSGKQRIVAATESFGQASTRLHSTKLIVEGVMDTIKSVWEAIKSMAKRIWDKIVQFFGKIFGSAKSLRDHLENLRKRVGEIKSDAKMKETEITGGVAKKISVKKKADLNSYKEICKVSQQLAKVANGVGAESSIISGEVQTLTGQLQGGGITESNLNTFAGFMTTHYNKIAALLAVSSEFRANVANKSSTKGTSKTQIKKTDTYGPFANGQVLRIEELTKTFKVGSGTASYSYVSIDFTSVEDKEVADKAKALNRGEILEVINAASEVCSDAEAMEKNKAEIKKLVDNAQSSAENALKTIGKMTEDKADATARVALNEARDCISTMFSLMNQLGQRIPAIVLNAAYAGADYASVCIANHK